MRRSACVVLWTVLCSNFGPQLFDCVLGNKDAVMERAIKGVSGELGTSLVLCCSALIAEWLRIRGSVACAVRCAR